MCVCVCVCVRAHLDSLLMGDIGDSSGEHRLVFTKHARTSAVLGIVEFFCFFFLKNAIFRKKNAKTKHKNTGGLYKTRADADICRTRHCGMFLFF